MKKEKQDVGNGDSSIAARELLRRGSPSRCEMTHTCNRFKRLDKERF